MDFRLLIVFAGAMIGGLVQSVTGFGCGVVMMIFMPMLFNLLQASAITSALSIALTVSLAFRFRKSLEIGKLILPSVIYIVLCNTMIWISTSLNTQYLLLAFGIFLLLLAAYFFFARNRVKLPGTPATAVAVSSLSGVTAGLFGIGGPLMAPYFLSVTKTKEGYIALIQTLFACSTVISLISRILHGIYTIELLPATLTGMTGVILGRQVGLKILDRINIETMSNLVYIMMGLSGILTILTNL